MPMEFYQGRPLEPEELEAIRQQIEHFNTIPMCRRLLLKTDPDSGCQDHPTVLR